MISHDEWNMTAVSVNVHVPESHKAKNIDGCGQIRGFWHLHDLLSMCVMNYIISACGHYTYICIYIYIYYINIADHYHLRGIKEGTQATVRLRMVVSLDPCPCNTLSEPYWPSFPASDSMGTFCVLPCVHYLLRAQIFGYRLMGTKVSSEPIVTHSQLDPQ